MPTIKNTLGRIRQELRDPLVFLLFALVAAMGLVLTMCSTYENRDDILITVGMAFGLLAVTTLVIGMLLARAIPRRIILGRRQPR